VDAKADLGKLAADVIVSVLAVQNFSIERAFGLLDGLEAQGFFDFPTVANWSEAEALQRLEAAGLSRGPHFNQIFAKRIRSIAGALGTAGLADLLRLEREQNVKAIEDKLMDLWGVGPAVVWNYKVLRSLGPKQST
jgi:3-methyladenine DNA glycosylase/8-oxoguanine DNA glycosylase